MHIYHFVLPVCICSHHCIFHLSHVVTVTIPNTSPCQLIPLLFLCVAQMHCSE